MNNNETQKKINNPNFISQNNIEHSNNNINYNNYNNLIKEENNIDQKLKITLIYLDIYNLIPVFTNNNISFNDIFLLSKSDLIELGLSMMQRNRILKFSELFQINAIDYSIEEINIFFQKNKNLNIKNIQNFNNYNFNHNNYNNINEKIYTFYENNDSFDTKKMINKEDVHVNENYDKYLNSNNSNNNNYNNIKLNLKVNNKNFNSNYNSDYKENNSNNIYKNNNINNNINNDENNKKLELDINNSLNNKNK